MKPTYTLHHYLKDAGVRDIPSNLPDFPMAFEPRESQKTGLSMMLTDLKFGLFDDAGTGKTVIMQAYALLYIAWGNKVLCLMPPILLDQFHETLHETFLGSEDWMNAVIMDFGPAKRDKTFPEWDAENAWPDMLLMTYEIFLKLQDIFKPRGYDILITDEAQNLKGSESKIHAAVYNYTEGDDTALVLATGTPLHHTPVDGFAMTRLINREAYLTLRGFERKHCEKKSFKISKRIRGRMRKIRVSQITGYKNLDLLNRNLYAHARRVTKDQVLSRKTPTILTVRVSLGKQHQTLYDKLASEKMLEIGEDRVLTATEAVQMREHLMQLACSPQLYSEKSITNNILVELDQLMDSIGPDKKIAIYAHHNSTIETLDGHFRGQMKSGDEPPALVYGGQSDSKSRKSVSLFKNDPTVTRLIAHPQSGGVGLNLQHVCHNLIFFEPTSIHGDFMQVLARFDRTGQKHAVLVYLISVIGTTYPKMIETMLDNSDRARGVNLDKFSFRDFISGGV